MNWTKFAQNVMITDIGQQYIFIHWLEVVVMLLVIKITTTMTMERQAGDLQQSLVYE